MGLFLRKGSSVKKSWGFAVFCGTVGPAILFSIILSIIGLSNVHSVSYEKNFRDSISIFMPAIMLMGLLIPPIYSAQNYLAPFKAGSVYSVISISGAVGDSLAVVLALIVPKYSNDYGYMHSSLVMISCSVALVGALLTYCTIDYNMIEELLPCDFDGSQKGASKVDTTSLAASIDRPTPNIDFDLYDGVVEDNQMI